MERTAPPVHRTWDSFHAAHPELEAWLAERSGALADQPWPEEQLQRLGELGVYRWFLPPTFGGWWWSYDDLLRGYLTLSRGCLTTAFVLTQWAAGVKRLLASENSTLKRELAPRFASGEDWVTVAISHLTTSRQHLQRPAVQAVPVEGGYVLTGEAPWCSGARHASHVVVGAALDDGRQIVALVATDLPGLSCPEPLQLVALGASSTGPVRLEACFVPSETLLAGPIENALQKLSGGAGGLETSCLALGLSGAAGARLAEDAKRRPELSGPAESFSLEQQRLEALLLQSARGEEGCTANELRTWANQLALRTTQSALTAAKGAGFERKHPVGRWCQEALFFLVWSCPQPVAHATMCDLAGLVLE